MCGRQGSLLPAPQHLLHTHHNCSLQLSPARLRGQGRNPTTPLAITFFHHLDRLTAEPMRHNPVLPGTLESDRSLFPADRVLRALCNHVGAEDEADAMEADMQSERKELGGRAQWRSLDQAVPEAHTVSFPGTCSYTSPELPLTEARVSEVSCSKSILTGTEERETAQHGSLTTQQGGLAGSRSPVGS